MAIGHWSLQQLVPWNPQFLGAFKDGFVVQSFCFLWFEFWRGRSSTYTTYRSWRLKCWGCWSLGFGGCTHVTFSMFNPPFFREVHRLTWCSYVENWWSEFFFFRAQLWTSYFTWGEPLMFYWKVRGPGARQDSLRHSPCRVALTTGCHGTSWNYTPMCICIYIYIYVCIDYRLIYSYIYILHILTQPMANL